MKLLIVRTFPDILDPESYNVQEIGLAKALTKKGISCGIVLFYGKNKDEIEKIYVDCDGEQREIIVYRLRGYRILKNGFFPSLANIVKMYDVIQVHEYDQISSWLYYAWSKKPVVVYHGPYYHPFNKGYNLKCKIFDLTLLVVKKNKNVPCMTKSIAAADFLKSKGFCNVIPVGVGLDTDSFKRNNTKPIVERTDKKNYQLLYVGKLEERRNSLFLLDIFRGLLEKDMDIELTVIGSGEKTYKDMFISAAEDLIRTGKVRYIPKVTQQELGVFYQNADIMVFPSRYEIFGMVLLEALYHDLPVVSSENGGADMLIRNRENGLLIEHFDCKIWIEEIYKLLVCPGEYERIKENLKKENKERLTWDGVADLMIEQYKKIYFEKKKL